MLEFSKDHVATLVRRTSENSVKRKFDFGESPFELRAKDFSVLPA